MKIKDKRIYGLQTISVILENYPESILRLFYKKDTPNKRIQAFIAKAQKLGIATEVMTDKKHLGKVHQPLMAECKSLPRMLEHDLGLMAANDEKSTFLILDGISDPHNLGAILRTSAAMGITAVIAPKRNSVGLTATVRNVACGGAEVVPFFPVSNLANTMRMLQDENVWIYGADANAGTSLKDVVFPKKTCLVFGNEHDGMRHLTKEHCDELISIPLTQNMDSLNVSVAAGMFIYEAIKRKV